VKSSSRVAFVLILASFFISGVAGLLYQVVWTRYLALFLGHTSYAVVAVLAAFMGGLALGNAWLGTWVDRVRRPLLFYALLELGIGVYALLFPNYQEIVHGWFIGLVKAWQPSGAVRLALQFLFAGVTILFPTVLMGATLPALTKFVTRSLAELRGKVAALYAINSTGAVLGTLLTDWWWIPGYGLEVVVYFGSAMSLGIGLLAYVLSRVTEEGEGAAAKPAVAAEAAETFSPGELRLALVGIGVSGFVAMLYEVAWTRLLALALGSSTHAYSLMLATFISGIAAGGWLVYRWKRQTNTLRAFAWAELALATTLFASLWFYDLLPWWFTRLAGLLARTPSAYPLYELWQGLICFAVMFLPAVCLGMTLPLVSRVATAELAHTGRSVGRVFAVNTLGTVLGAVLTGLLFLPWLGLARTFVIGIALNLLVGASVLVRGRRRMQLGFAGAALAGIALLWFISGSILTPRWQRTFAAGFWRDPSPAASLAGYRKEQARVDLLSYQDGSGSSVAVTRQRNEDGKEELSLRTNGKVDAGTALDMSTQLLIGHLPLLLHAPPTNVLVIGVGSGVTVSAVLQHPGVQRVDVVEISPEMVAAARRMFQPFNRGALDDPRTHLHIEDAKTFLQTTEQRYDVIVSEPSNPWMAGVAAVFSREFYEDCRARLRPGGIAAQWLQGYESDNATFDLVAATFSSVFPQTSIWQTAGDDLLLVGSEGPQEPDFAQMSRRMAEPAMAADLGRAGISGMNSLLSLQLVAAADGATMPAADTRIQSDFVPALEYAAQRAFFVRRRVTKLDRLSELNSPRPRTLLGRWLSQHPMDAADCEALAKSFSAARVPTPALFRSIVLRWLMLEPGSVKALKLLSLLSDEAPGLDAEAMRLANRAEFRGEAALSSVETIRGYVGALLVGWRIQRSAWHVPSPVPLEPLLRQLIEKDAGNERVHRLHLAEVLWDLGRDDEFLVEARKVFALENGRPGEARFALDPRAPGRVLGLMLDLFQRRGDVAMTRQIVRESMQQRFLGPEAIDRDPVLEWRARRVVAEAAAGPRTP
jgi:predicted membrane-bound spermidine synthase